MDNKENKKSPAVKANGVKTENTVSKENKNTKTASTEKVSAVDTKENNNLKTPASTKTKTASTTSVKNENSKVETPLKDKKTKTERRTNKVVPPSTRTSLVLPPEPKQKKKKESNGLKEKYTTNVKNKKQKTAQEKEKPAIQVSEETYNKINMNDMNLRIASKEGMLLVDEDCCTALNILLQKDGGLQTSFLGSYNNEILKLMRKTLNVYFKNLKKKLKKHNTENVMEDITNKK